MIPVGALVGFLLAAVVTYMMPKVYESSATIEIRPRGRMIEPEVQGVSRITVPVCGTEFEKIKSRNSLKKVIEALGLTNKWDMNEEAALKVLKEIVTVEDIRGTDLRRVSVRFSSKEDARDIALEVARAYLEYREELEAKKLEKGIEELKRAVREQEDRVEEIGKILSTITRSIGAESDGISSPPTTEDYIAAKRDFETEQSLLAQMKVKIAGCVDYDTLDDTIIIHEDPVISDSPVSPNVTLNLILGFAGGALLSPFLALPLMWMTNWRNKVC